MKRAEEKRNSESDERQWKSMEDGRGDRVPPMLPPALVHCIAISQLFLLFGLAMLTHTAFIALTEKISNTALFMLFIFNIVFWLLVLYFEIFIVFNYLQALKIMEW